MTSKSSEAENDRSKERTREEVKYTQVIIKRSDEARRHPDDILEIAIHEGLRQHNRRPLSLFLSAIAAGLILGFTVLAVAVASSAFSEVQPYHLKRVLIALFYPLGFVICVMSGTQLFTEHTATAFYPVLDRRVSYSSVLRVWVLVIAGNLVGALCSAALLYFSDAVVGAGGGYIDIANHAMSAPLASFFISSMLAGWLMAQGSWLILSTPPNLSQIVCIYIVTFLIGVGGLHHSIAGAVEVFTGYLFSNDISIVGISRFLSVALIGNLVGGSMFVALLNYAQIRETQTD